jgi:hypothetical protein
MAFDVFDAVMHHKFSNRDRPNMEKRLALAGIHEWSALTLEEFCKVHTKLISDPEIKNRAEVKYQERYAAFWAAPFDGRYLQSMRLRVGTVEEVLGEMSAAEKRQLRERMVGVLQMAKRAEVSQ